MCGRECWIRATTRAVASLHIPGSGRFTPAVCDVAAYRTGGCRLSLDEFGRMCRPCLETGDGGPVPVTIRSSDAPSFIHTDGVEELWDSQRQGDRSGRRHAGPGSGHIGRSCFRDDGALGDGRIQRPRYRKPVPAPRLPVPKPEAVFCSCCPKPPRRPSPPLLGICNCRSCESWPLLTWRLNPYF